MTEEERHREVLAARTEALAEKLRGLETVCKIFVEQATEVGCAAKDLRLELEPEASDGS